MKCKCELDNMDSPSRIASNILDALDTAEESLSAIDYINIRSRVFYLITSVDPMFVTPDNVSSSARNLTYSRDYR